MSINRSADRPIDSRRIGTIAILIRLDALDIANLGVLVIARVNDVLRAIMPVVQELWGKGGDGIAGVYHAVVVSSFRGLGGDVVGHFLVTDARHAEGYLSLNVSHVLRHGVEEDNLRYRLFDRSLAARWQRTKRPYRPWSGR